jgi:uncharacterized protein (TIGR00297 family)
VAATLVGAASLIAGWDWGALLLLFFLSGTGWTRVGRAGKEARTAAVIAKGGSRDFVQVLANGGVFAVAAAGFILSSRAGRGPAPVSEWRAVGLGALAAATADTWATEVGTLWGGTPRSLLTRKTVPPGTSGGVTLVGTLAGIAGAACLALAAVALGWGFGLGTGSLIAGFGGMMIDSVVGATAQSRRWCERCNEQTERATHTCGAATRHVGGLPWLNNDGVNAVSTVAGAAIAWAVLRGAGR